MRNLSKVLALVLALVLAFGMLSAGAASFTDSKDITATEAVDMLSTLGVINGYPDGTFNPNGTVTRAEMAKMIFTIRNGGNSDASAYASMATPFKDVVGHWAKGYINYCYTMGIVNGKSATSFDPNAPVTGLEAAKMALVCLGYNAQTAGLTGLGWDQKTAALATDAGLFADYNKAITAGAPRQLAAQLLYNALFADTVRLVDGVYETKAPDSGVKYGTLGSKYLSLNTYEGILLSSGNYGVQANVPAACAVSPAKDKIQIAVQKTNNNTKKDVAALVAADSKTFDCTTDYSALVGQYVKVTTGKNDKVYGIYAVADQNKVVTSILGKVKPVDSDTIKIDGTEYDFASGALRYNGETSTGDFTFAPEPKDASAVTFIDNTGDGKFDIALVIPIASVNKVTFVSSTSFTAGTAYNFKDVLCYDGIAKDDYVVKTTNYFADKASFAKADVVEGKVSATKGAVGSLTDIQIGGTWYKLVSSNDVDGSQIAIDNTYKIAVVKGYVYSAKLTASGSKDLALVTGVAGSVDSYGNYQTNLLLADGTTKTVSAKTQETVGDFVTYKVDGNAYELTDVGAGNKAGYDNYDDTTYTYGYDKDTKSVTNANNTLGKKISDTAIVFIRYDKDGAGTKTEYANKVITGADLNSFSSDYATNSVEVLYNNGGFADAQVVYLYGNLGTALPGVASSKTIAYVTSEPYTLQDGSTTYFVYDVWTTSGSMTVKDKAASAPAKGDVVTFDLVADQFVENVTAASAPVAITGFDANRKIIGIDGVTKDLTDDYKVLYVDTANDKGIEGGEVAVAQEPSTGVFYKNARVVYDGLKVQYIVVDATNNKWDAAPYTLAAMPAAMSVNGLTYTLTASPAAGTVNAGTTITATLTPSGTATAAENRTITITLTGLDGTVTSRTLTFTAAAGATPAAQTATFTMPYANAAFTIG